MTFLHVSFISCNRRQRTGWEDKVFLYSSLLLPQIYHPCNHPEVSLMPFCHFWHSYTFWSFALSPIPNSVLMWIFILHLSLPPPHSVCSQNCLSDCSSQHGVVCSLPEWLCYTEWWFVKIILPGTGNSEDKRKAQEQTHLSNRAGQNHRLKPQSYFVVRFLGFFGGEDYSAQRFIKTGVNKTPDQIFC